MSLYKCSSCDGPIQATRARLSCASCTPRMTLCANCYVVQDYPPQHQDDASHSILLHRHSGFLPVPPPPPPRAQPVRSLSTSYGPPRRRPVSAANNDVPPRKPPRPTKSETTEAEEVEDVPVTPPPSRPLDPPQQNTEQHSRQQSQPTSWSPFLNGDMKPSPSFIRLVEELFHHLDPQHTGYLSPEVYSEYLEACGAPDNHNIWRYSHTKNAEHGYDIADRELTDHFTAYSVDFTLRPRTPSSTPMSSALDPLSYLPATPRNALARFMPASTAVSGNQKPMLSLRGFTDLALCSVLLNPSTAWGQLNRAMQVFRIPVWTECGDIPRGMLPLGPYQPEVERVRVLLEGARFNAEQEMDALHARLKLEQRGRQHALDLLDDRVWVYR
ncbi:hypothetical protein BDW62DRAFT_194659 [Aspergillus aurantiobrunneus]